MSWTCSTISTQLVGTREEFLLGRWLDEAKRWGKTEAERDLYEWNARNIITLWGTKCTEGQNDDLNLYAYKEWQGMFSSYYLPRWKEFFARLNRSLATGVPFDRQPFAADICRWEQEWSRQHHGLPDHGARRSPDGIAVPLSEVPERPRGRAAVGSGPGQGATPGRSFVTIEFPSLRPGVS